jgi:hypothetical protein
VLKWSVLNIDDDVASENEKNSAKYEGRDTTKKTFENGNGNEES